MSQKKRKEQPAAPVPETETPSETLSVTGPEHLRKALLGLTTALLIARPLVLGEDPGMLSHESGTSNLVLTLLWLAAFVGWAVWRVWSGKREIHGGIVEAGLFVAAIAIAASTGVANYRHPAVLIAWEWIAFVLALFLVRQLATTESDRRHLLAALLAGVVAVSAHAIFHYAYLLPISAKRLQEDRPPIMLEARQPGDVRMVRDLFGESRAGPLQAVTYLYLLNAIKQNTPTPLDAIRRRLEENYHATATFAHSNTFAGYLLLFVPALLFAVPLAFRHVSERWKAYLIGAAGVVVLIALFLSHSRGAFLGLGIAAMLAGGIALLRGQLPGIRALIIIGVGGVFVVAILAGLFDPMLGKSGGTTRNRVNYWSSTCRMILDRPILGVGVGNFQNEYPAYMREGAYEVIGDPHNFALEMWATAGIVAMLGVLLAFTGFFKLALFSPKVSGVEGEKGETTEGPRWDFYLWGSVGLLLAYVLQRTGLSAVEIEKLLKATDVENDAETFLNNFISITQAGVWFVTFALFSGIRWPGRAMPTALAVGVLAAVVNLSVSGGISSPSFAVVLWAVVGLALAGLNLRPRRSKTENSLLLYAPLPVALGLLAAFVVYPFDPVLSSTRLQRAAVIANLRALLDQRENRPAISSAPGIRPEQVHRFLEQAVREDPGDAKLQLLIHYRDFETFRSFRNNVAQGRPYAMSALTAAKEANRLNRKNAETLKTLYNVQLMFAGIDLSEKGRDSWYEQAIQTCHQMIKRDDTDPVNYFTLARTLLAAGRKKEALEAGGTALKYDEAAIKPPRQLSDWQRILIHQWGQP